jgi:hypothetical protein
MYFNQLIANQLFEIFKNANNEKIMYLDEF